MSSSSENPDVIRVSASTSASQIQSIINNADPSTIIELDAGTFRFDQTVIIDRSDISIRGAGSEATQIVMDAGMGKSPAFQIGHEVNKPSLTPAGDIARDASKGAQSITVDAGHSLKAGDALWISRENTDEFFDEIGDELWQREKPLRTALVVVESVNGDQIALDRPLPFDFDADETEVEHIELLSGVTLGGFAVESELGESDPGRFANNQSAHSGATAISVAGTKDAKLYDIAIDEAASHGFTVAKSIDLNAIELSVDGAHNKGSGGNGYGLWVRDVYDSSFTDLKVMDTRHAVVFASYTSATGNTVHLTETNRDINFHGGRDKDNTVVVDSSLRVGDEQSYMAPTVFFNDGKSYGAPTDQDANSVEFRQVLGTVRAEEVVAHSDGAYLNTRGGDDVLIGAQGDDFMSGGTGNDRFLTSTGTDRMVGGDGYDTVSFGGSLSTHSVERTDDGLLISQGANQTYVTEIEQFIFGNQTYSYETLERVAGDMAANSVQISADAGVLLTGGAGWERLETSISATLADNVSAVRLIGDGSIDVTANDANNHVIGNTGDNTIVVNGGNDRVFGSSGADSIDGGSGNDYIHGGSGADWLMGGQGDDTLIGASGADTFVASGGRNVVVDFNAGQGDRFLFNEISDQEMAAALMEYSVGEDMAADLEIEATQINDVDYISISTEGGANLTIASTNFDELIASLESQVGFL